MKHLAFPPAFRRVLRPAAHAAACAFSLALAACAQQPPGPTVEVYASRGSLQCTGGGVPVAELQRRLSDAGVTVLESACGSDGRIRPAVCGAPDGAIAIFRIPASHTATADARGFRPLAELPGATRGACR